VLCRYHARSGNPGAVTTIKETWGRKGVTKSLYLPSEIDMIVNRLPDGTGITLESLIWEHTMYPYIKPSLIGERADFVYAMLLGREKKCRNTYQKAGLVGRRLALPEYLRFCPACVESGIEQYGEAYWHRLHQLPGVRVCPVHKEYIRDSRFFVNMIFRYFIPATLELCACLSQIKKFSKETEARHFAFAEDCAWILEHGARLGAVEDMYEKHFRLMEAKGYLGYTPITAQCHYRSLNRAIHEFYGREFLKSMIAYDEDDYSSWPAAFARNKKSNPPTAQHLLLMRFLAGSPGQFMDSSEQFLPFGEPPWPCHNKICEHYLKDYIDEIEIKVVHGQHKAVFTCPHCGFSYRRGKATPKESQYEGQVRMVDFGWLWKAKLKECLADRGLCVYHTMLEMGYPERTIRKYAIGMDFLPENRMPVDNRVYKKVKIEVTALETEQSRKARWLRLVAEHPSAKRSELGRMDLENYKWLLYNDYEWFDANTPAPFRKYVDWHSRDEEYLVKATQAVAEMSTQPGRPLWLCYSSVANRAGLGNRIYSILGKLPLTKQYLDSVVEAKDEWRKRKLLWAIQHLRDSGQALSYDSVYHASGISRRVAARFREYVEYELQQINTK